MSVQSSHFFLKWAFIYIFFHFSINLSLLNLMKYEFTTN